jgi:hypothetical protein
LLLYLETNGKRATIELDKPFDLEALAGDKTATLRAEPYRVFPYAGLSFRYPRGYSFEAKLKPNLSTWTLKGSHVVITIDRFPGLRDHVAIRQAMVKNMLKSYAGSKTRELDTQLDVKGATLTGRRIEVTLAATLLHQDLLSLVAGNDTVVLMLQDTPQEDGKPSPERVVVDNMLRETLRLPAK